jgi:hypothetical protein
VGSTITSDVNVPIRVIEISHGEHQTAFGPTESIGVKVDQFGVAHVDVDNAVVSVSVTNDITGKASICTSAEITTWADRDRTGSVEAKDHFGAGPGSRTLDHGGALITITAICEEVAKITITERRRSRSRRATRRR